MIHFYQAYDVYLGQMILLYRENITQLFYSRLLLIILDFEEIEHLL